RRGTAFVLERDHRSSIADDQDGSYHLRPPAQDGRKLVALPLREADRHAPAPASASAAAAGARRGRRTSSPPQFGHTCSSASPHDAQKVHSYEQMTASASGASPAPHRSHAGRISSAIRTVPA